ncbi:uncharacterized protein METZ01_LOCUS267094, partial [marine metagenome]
MAFDYIISGGDIIDGTGKNPRYQADVGIEN